MGYVDGHVMKDETLNVIDYPYSKHKSGAAIGVQTWAWVIKIRL